MTKVNNDETEFWESYDEDHSDSYSSGSGDETIDETNYRNQYSGGSEDADDNDRTMSIKKKKPEILGFLVIKKGKRKNDKFDLTKEDIIIGKNQRCCDITIDDDDVSRIHCRIRKDPDKNEFHFFDCGSTNGSFVNDEDVHHVVLKSHDKIVLGENVELVFVQV